MKKIAENVVGWVLLGSILLGFFSTIALGVFSVVWFVSSMLVWTGIIYGLISLLNIVAEDEPDELTDDERVRAHAVLMYGVDYTNDDPERISELEDRVRKVLKHRKMIN